MIEWLKILLEHEGYEVRTAMIGTRGEEIFKTWKPDVVVTDMMLPDVDGLELLRKFKQTHADTEVHRHHRPWQRAEGGRGDEGRARTASSRSRSSPTRCWRCWSARSSGAICVGENLLLKQKLEGQFRFGNIIGKSKKMHEVLELVESVAGSDANILIQGENGTGKELIANAHPLQQQAGEGAVHQDQLRGDPEGPDRVGAVRLQEGRVHRRAERQGRPLRDGRGGLAAARRDRRDAAVPADQAAARAAGARIPADRQRSHRPRRLPADLRDQHRSRRGAARRQAARGPLLPHQHHHAARAAAARAHRRHPAPLRALPREVPAAPPAQRQVDRAGGVSRPDPAPLAGQRPRARERHRARRAGREGHRDHRQRSAGVAAHRDARRPPSS